jgi:hypothetical protein
MQVRLLISMKNYEVALIKAIESCDNELSNYHSLYGKKYSNFLIQQYTW